MNNKGKKTEQELLSALADAVEDSVVGKAGEASPRPPLSHSLPAGEDTLRRKRTMDFSGLSLDDEPLEKTAEQLAAEAQARRAAYDELAADPRLKALDQRAAEEEARLHARRHHSSIFVEAAGSIKAPAAPAASADVPPAEAAAPLEAPSAPTAKEPAEVPPLELELPSAEAPVSPSRAQVAEAEELLSSEAFVLDEVTDAELVSSLPGEDAAPETAGSADAVPDEAGILDKHLAEPAPETAEAPAAPSRTREAPAVEAPAPEETAGKEVEKNKVASPKEEKNVAEAVPAEAPLSVAQSHVAEKKPRSKLAKVLTSTLLILLETVLLIVVALYGIMFLLARGPSGTASRLFVRSVKETSAIGFLANLYFNEDEIQALMSAPGEAEYVETDTDLISMTSIPEDSAKPDAWGFVDEDGDILDEVKGEGYSGYMMIVLDPSRVILGSNPATYGSRGYTVEEFVQMYDAVAGINGGAFQDENGMGTGAYPEGLVVYEGQTYNWGVKQGFAGIDDKHILHVGCQSLEDAVAANIQYGASYGPVLVQNGYMTSDDTLESGLNPRTAIGQRSDGAFLLLVIDGRQVISLGATYLDEAEIMLRYGAVNAVNLDGGSSSMMYYNGSYVNNSASVVGIRPIPTSFIVLKEGRN